jgi:hypothetical protein
MAHTFALAHKGPPSNRSGSLRFPEPGGRFKTVPNRLRGDASELDTPQALIVGPRAAAVVPRSANSRWSLFDAWLRRYPAPAV